MNSKNKGFTLIELLIVIAIVGILAATAVVNFAKNDDRDVRQERDHLTTFLREVQNKALAGERANIRDSIKKVCGFGFRQAGSNIESFYFYTSRDDDNCTKWKDYTDSGTYETFYPSKGIALGMSGQVFFISPSGTVDCSGACPSPTITITKGSASVDITVDAAGRIY